MAKLRLCFPPRIKKAECWHCGVGTTLESTTRPGSRWVLADVGFYDANQEVKIEQEGNWICGRCFDIAVAHQARCTRLNQTDEQWLADYNSAPPIPH